MPKKSKADAFWEVTAAPRFKFFATDDLVLLEVRVDKTNHDFMARRNTLTELMQLENFLRRGWQIIAATPFEDAHYKTIAYTLYKPIERA